MVVVTIESDEVIYDHIWSNIAVHRSSLPLARTTEQMSGVENGTRLYVMKKACEFDPVGLYLSFLIPRRGFVEANFRHCTSRGAPITHKQWQSVQPTIRKQRTMLRKKATKK